MSNFIFSIDVVMPMILLIFLGYVLRYFGFITSEFQKVGSRMCFYIFLPCSLFKNLYDSSLDFIPWHLIIYALSCLLIIFIISIIITVKAPNKKRGTMIQGMIRSNYAYVGIPLATQMFSDSILIGQASTNISLLSIFIVPMFSILSVISLSFYNDDNDGSRLKKTIRNIIKNPIIIGILVGIIVLLVREFIPASTNYVKNNLSFVYKALSYLSSVATPLSLIVVGAGLKFNKAKDFKDIIFVVLCKMIIYPSIILFVAYKLNIFTSPEIAVLVSTFASPTAVSSAIMASEMGGDEDLGNNIVVFSTVASAFTLLLIIFALKSVGLI